MRSPLILLIDDSAAIRRMVEYHLTEAGYRVLIAVDGETGCELAASQHPDLIILDHQLPGVTGDQVCRMLLESETTARIPVLVSSTLRSRALVHYSDLPNVIDQLPKPYTSDLLRGGVDNALQNGAMIVQAQWDGLEIPESVEPTFETILEGSLNALPPANVLHFLMNSQLTGRLVLLSGGERIKFAVAAGKIQAVYSSTIAPGRLIEHLPDDLHDFAPLIPFALAEQKNDSMSGLLKLFENTLSHATHLKALLRFQSSFLTHHAFHAEPGTFAFDTYASLPPLFQAFPLQISFAALAIDGVFHVTPRDELNACASLVFGRRHHRLGIIDRTGLSPIESAIDSGLDGTRTLAEIADRLAIPVPKVAAVALGLEMAGHVERVSPEAAMPILLLDAEPDTARMVRSFFQADPGRFLIREIRDRIAARLLVRRIPFALIIMMVNTPADESFLMALKEVAPRGCRFARIVDSSGEDPARIDRDLGLDAVVKRPLVEAEFRTLLNEMLQPSVAFYA